jgi:translation initiation factor 3 subunit H
MASRGKDTGVNLVQIDGLVVLKIVKHCQEEGQGGSEPVQGVLLGLVEEKRLEVTNCFPFPRHTEDEDFDEVHYQMEMMRNLRHVNIDHLHVGWYQSSTFGSYINRALLDSQFNYQHSIEESIVIVYDPLKTAKGFLSLKALRLTPATMELYKENDFSPDSVKKAGLSFEHMFEEVPIVIKNSHLINALCCEVEESKPTDNPYNYLDLATSSMLEKNVKSLIESVDEMSQDANKFFNYQRQLIRQQQAKQQFQAKRASENALRVARGEQPLPDDDINRMFKPPQPPPRLDSLLLSQQINAYVEQITEFATQSFGKLFMADSLQVKEEEQL